MTSELSELQRLAARFHVLAYVVAFELFAGLEAQLARWTPVLQDFQALQERTAAGFK
jgi:hypothetical protein